MSTARTWPVPISRKPVKSRRVDPPIEQTWLFKINPQRALEMAATPKRRAK